MLSVLDLFSGIGGFSLGLERTKGFKTVAFCEIEEFPRAVLAKHWPGVKCYCDVRQLGRKQLEADGISVDVICGGFPCQDISIAGKGAGLAGARSGLWSEFPRLIGELRPQYAIVENVSALLGRGFGTILGDLAALGYDAEWHCIPASAIGAPHQRDRVWIVAYPIVNEPQRRRAARNTGNVGEGRKTWRSGQSVGADSIAHDVADTDSGGRREQGHVSQAFSHPCAGQLEYGSEALADTASARCDKGRSDTGGALWDKARRIKPQRHGSLDGNVRQSGSARLEIGPGTLRKWAYAATTGTGWWATEPDVGRVVDELSSKVDRRKRLIGLGNAVVPAIPELIGRAILNYEKSFT